MMGTLPLRCNSSLEQTEIKYVSFNNLQIRFKRNLSNLIHKIFKKLTADPTIDSPPFKPNLLRAGSGIASQGNSDRKSSPTEFTTAIFLTGKGGKPDFFEILNKIAQVYVIGVDSLRSKKLDVLFISTQT